MMTVFEVLAVCPCGAEVKGNPRLAKDRGRKYCSPGCSGRFNGGAAVAPPILASVRCPCGTEFEVNQNTVRGRRRKYCSRPCVGRHNGTRPPPTPAASHCRRCGEPMTEGNFYVDKDGRRRCRNCVSVRNQGRSREPAVRKPRARKPNVQARVPEPLSIPGPVKGNSAEPAAPVEAAPTYRWLSAPGWTTAEPNIPRRTA